MTKYLHKVMVNNKLATPAILSAKEIRKNQASTFINWLQFSLISGLLEANKPDSYVHTPPDGMLLVSPCIFTKTGYLEALSEYHLEFYSLAYRRNPIDALKKNLLEFGYLKHSTTSKSKSFIVSHSIKEGTENPEKVHCLLIPNSCGLGLFPQSDFLDDADGIICPKTGGSEILEPMPKKNHEKEIKARVVKQHFHHANAFLDWLRNTIVFDDIAANKVDSLLHFLPQGLLIRSPQIFLRFLRDYSNFNQLRSNKIDPLRQMQKELQKCGALIFNLDGHSFFHRYCIEINSQKKSDDVANIRAFSFYLIDKSVIPLSFEPVYSICVTPEIPTAEA